MNVARPTTHYRRSSASACKTPPRIEFRTIKEPITFFFGIGLAPEKYGERSALCYVEVCGLTGYISSKWLMGS